MGRKEIIYVAIKRDRDQFSPRNIIIFRLLFDGLIFLHDSYVCSVLCNSSLTTINFINATGTFKNVLIE